MINLDHNATTPIDPEVREAMLSFCDNLRKWAAEHPHDGPVVHNAEELRQLVAAKERQRAGQPALTLNEEPPKPTAKPPSAHEP